MAGPSGRAFGPPKGMLVPAIHAFLCVSPASRGWPGQGPAMTRGQRPRPPPRYVSASADKPGHDGKVRPMRLNQTAACCSVAKQPSNLVHGLEACFVAPLLATT